MANHLSLTHTLLEIDDQRHLRIYQHGKYAHLRPPEVRQLTSWLRTRHVNQLETDYNSFKCSPSRVYINTSIVIGIWQGFVPTAAISNRKACKIASAVDNHLYVQRSH